ncbi:MAG: UbiH/UbiF family hydroxylase [Rhodocyclaceae bacterium]|nr:UbiH/UbiF family hydroxylase [Rhodocyclaceae bacterium]
MNYDVIIVGGGLAGLSLAVALRKSRLSVALVEGRPPVRPEGWDTRIYALSPANASFLGAIGVWPHLDEARLTPVRKMVVRGDGAGVLEFSAYQSGVGELAWIAEASLVQLELWESAKRQGNLELFCPAKPALLDIGDDSAVLELADRRTLTGKLIVAADGADSWTRAAAGIEVEFKPYDRVGVVANFSAARPHRETAFQWFRDDGVLAYLPLPGNLISIVWSAPTALAEELLRLDEAALCERVAAAGECALGRLKLVTPPVGFPLRLMRAPRFVSHRFALIGDAAHTIHPLSGHGINLGFQDAQSLAEVLSACPPHIDCGDLQWLRRHERARREEVVALQSVTDGLFRLFGTPFPPLAALRNLGLNLVDRLPVVKDFFVRYAMG